MLKAARVFLPMVLVGAAACSGGGGGIPAADAEADAGPSDGGDVIPDVRPPPRIDGGVSPDALGDVGPYPCDPLTPKDAGLGVPASLTGRIDVFDFDFWDMVNNRRSRVRNSGLNFRTQNLPINVATDAPYFTAIAPNTCAAFDFPSAQGMSGPTRNIGRELLLTRTTTDASTSSITMTFSRDVGAGGIISYIPASLGDQARFFDMHVFRLDRSWTWFTRGDPEALIRPAQALIDPVEDFQVTPALTSTSVPIVLSAGDNTIRWTAPVSAPAQMSIVFGRAVNRMGDGHYLVCHPIDDGEYTVAAADMAAFAPRPNTPFDMIVSRAQTRPFCNEGVTQGAVLHTLLYTGSAVVH